MKRRTSAGKNSTSKQNRFASIPSVKTQRSVFNRSHTVKTTGKAGYLYPIFVDEALPGDTFSLQMGSFIRMGTPLHAVMDNQYLEIFFFAVPNRLVWDNWQRFNGERDSPADSIDFVLPTMTAPDPSGYGEGSLHDYLGLPTKVPNLTNHSLCHRAYNLIWNEWFRDENLMLPRQVDTGDGPDNWINYNVPLMRGKRHDYFTASLPWAQKGDPVEIGVGGTAPLTIQIAGAGTPTFQASGFSGSGNLEIAGSPSVNTQFGGTNTSATGAVTWNDPALAGSGTADLSAASAVTINQLRESFQIQKLLERDARGGTRYTEIIRSHFGVVSPDSRLQRPEFLGGLRSRFNTHPVAATTQSGSTTNEFLGDIGGFVTGSADGSVFVKSFVEHCYVLGLVNIRAELTYQQGLERMFSRSTRYDFYWPAFAHLGEQAVLNKEIYAADDGLNDEVFGYQERWAEYRYKPSRVTAAFRSNHTIPLDTWHLAQNFTTRPSLNEQFIMDNPPVGRILAVPASNEQFIMDFAFDYRCARPMPTYSVPGLIDHF